MTAGGLAVTCSGAANVVAYRPGTGSIAWTWHGPKAPGIPDITSLSVGTDDGIGVVEYTYGEGSGTWRVLTSGMATNCGTCQKRRRRVPRYGSAAAGSLS